MHLVITIQSSGAQRPFYHSVHLFIYWLFIKFPTAACRVFSFLFVGKFTIASIRHFTGILRFDSQNNWCVLLH